MIGLKNAVNYASHLLGDGKFGNDRREHSGRRGSKLGGRDAGNDFGSKGLNDFFGQVFEAFLNRLAAFVFRTLLQFAKRLACLCFEILGKRLGVGVEGGEKVVHPAVLLRQQIHDVGDRLDGAVVESVELLLNLRRMAFGNCRLQLSSDCCDLDSSCCQRVAKSSTRSSIWPKAASDCWPSAAT